MHYELTMIAAAEIGDHGAVYDALGDSFDSASIDGGTLTASGIVRQRVDMARIMLALRTALGWPDGLRFVVSFDASRN